jgi:hypothetical protein
VVLELERVISELQQARAYLDSEGGEEVRSSGRLHGHASNGKGIPAHPTRQIVISRPALKERADASNHNERTDDECPNGLPEGEASTHLNGLTIPVKPTVSIDLQQIDFVRRN